MYVFFVFHDLFLLPTEFIPPKRLSRTQAFPPPLPPLPFASLPNDDNILLASNTLALVISMVPVIFIPLSQ